MTEAEDVEKLTLLRTGEADDLRLIFPTWLKGLYNGNDWFRRIKQDRFFKVYHGVIETILSRPGTVIHIACQKADTRVILGYAVIEDAKLHWIYIKPTWRGFGLAKKLIPESVKICTHLTSEGARRKPAQWEFDPFL